VTNKCSKIATLAPILTLVFLFGAGFAHSAPAVDYYTYGNQLYGQNNITEAKKYYEYAVQIDPNMWQAYMGVGYCEEQLGKSAEALASYKKALALNPGYAQLQSRIAALEPAVPYPPTSPPQVEVVPANPPPVQTSGQSISARKLRHIETVFGTFRTTSGAVKIKNFAVNVNSNFADAFADTGRFEILARSSDKVIGNSPAEAAAKGRELEADLIVRGEVLQAMAIRNEGQNKNGEPIWNIMSTAEISWQFIDVATGLVLKSYNEQKQYNTTADRKIKQNKSLFDLVDNLTGKPKKENPNELYAPNILRAAENISKIAAQRAWFYFPLEGKITAIENEKKRMVTIDFGRGLGLGKRFKMLILDNTGQILGNATVKKSEASYALIKYEKKLIGKVKVGMSVRVKPR